MKQERRCAYLCSNFHGSISTSERFCGIVEMATHQVNGCHSALDDFLYEVQIAHTDGPVQDIALVLVVAEFEIRLAPLGSQEDVEKCWLALIDDLVHDHGRGTVVSVVAQEVLDQERFVELDAEKQQVVLGLGVVRLENAVQGVLEDFNAVGTDCIEDGQWVCAWLCHERRRNSIRAHARRHARGSCGPSGVHDVG